MSTPLTDEFLKSIENLKQAETNPFLYTRLKGRMQQHVPGIQPSFAIVLLTVFLAANIFFLTGVFSRSQNESPAQAFATTYNLTTDSNY